MKGLPLYGLPVAVVDFETTGPDPSTCEPVSVAIVTFDLGQTKPELAYSTLIRPSVAIPPEATTIHGVTDEAVADAPAFEEVLPAMSGAIEGRCFAAYNALFDWGVWNSAAGLPFLFLDPFLWVRRLDKYKKGKRLVDAAGRRGVTFDAHDSRADALATAQLMPVLLKELRADLGWGQSTLGDVWAWQLRAGVNQERELAEYLRRDNPERDFDFRWRDAVAQHSTVIQ